MKNAATFRQPAATGAMRQMKSESGSRLGLLSKIDHSLGPGCCNFVSLYRSPSHSLDNPPSQGNADDPASRVGICQSEIRYRRLLETIRTDALPMRLNTARARSPATAFDQHLSTAGKTDDKNSNLIGRNAPDGQSSLQPAKISPASCSACLPIMTAKYRQKAVLYSL